MFFVKFNQPKNIFKDNFIKSNCSKNFCNMNLFHNTFNSSESIITWWSHNSENISCNMLFSFQSLYICVCVCVHDCDLVWAGFSLGNPCYIYQTF